MSCGEGGRRGSGLVLLCLWHGLVATALIRPLAWELPYALSVALKKQKASKQNPMCFIHLISCRKLVWIWEGTSSTEIKSRYYREMGTGRGSQ